MGPPPIQLFLTTIVSQTALRQRQEYILRILQVKKVPFTSYDLASDEEAKKLWHKQQLPGILIGGEFPGTFDEFEEAVEFEEVDQFLRLKEEWKPFEDDKPTLRSQPIGVPGAYSPAQMHPHHQPAISRSPSPLKSKDKAINSKDKVINSKDTKKIDAGAELGDSRLQGVNVTEDDLLALVEELGLGGDEANDLVKGLTGETRSTGKDGSSKAQEKHEEVGSGTKADAGQSETA
ncbi:uncharacterized protein LAESUDRAFT_759870 [Laetiporus sulphureus 93-53]|uniref:Uncharacterized protein n=1 Tax=Laetiporus sulphureus 93-53 TaxID=1314785 RepID=A0A165E024_9APHY|nr:uncharacterized protein LAESUDRAFT_759870 [Laetiporus sulphureus 93-53]KZT05986.1 hypothetical protein LAESUDRAFT_759870 [Laetiporus sulphureus 93-53]